MIDPDAVIAEEEAYRRAIARTLGPEKARAWRAAWNEMQERETRKQTIALLGLDAAIDDDELVPAAKDWLAEKLSAAGVERHDLWRHEELWTEVFPVSSWLGWWSSNRIKFSTAEPKRPVPLAGSEVHELDRKPAKPVEKTNEVEPLKEPERPQLHVIEGTARQHAELKRALFPEVVRDRGRSPFDEKF
jgi:hypothetical protein